MKGVKPDTLVKNRLLLWCFPGDIVKSFRAGIPWNRLGRLLLKTFECPPKIFIWSAAEIYSESCQTSTMRCFAKIVNG